MPWPHISAVAVLGCAAAGGMAGFTYNLKQEIAYQDVRKPVVQAGILAKDMTRLPAGTSARLDVQADVADEESEILKQTSDASAALACPGKGPMRFRKKQQRSRIARRCCDGHTRAQGAAADGKTGARCPHGEQTATCARAADTDCKLADAAGTDHNCEPLSDARCSGAEIADRGGGRAAAIVVM